MHVYIYKSLSLYIYIYVYMFPSELCRRRSGVFTEVARLVPLGLLGGTKKGRHVPSVAFFGRKEAWPICMYIYIYIYMCVYVCNVM